MGFVPHSRYQRQNFLFETLPTITHWKIIHLERLQCKLFYTSNFVVWYCSLMSKMCLFCMTSQNYISQSVGYFSCLPQIRKIIPRLHFAHLAASVFSMSWCHHFHIFCYSTSTAATGEGDSLTSVCPCSNWYDSCFLISWTSMFCDLKWNRLEYPRSAKANGREPNLFGPSF